jgi:predicted phosphodiesterase
MRRSRERGCSKGRKKLLLMVLLVGCSRGSVSGYDATVGRQDSEVSGDSETRDASVRYDSAASYDASVGDIIVAEASSVSSDSDTSTPCLERDKVIKYLFEGDIQEDSRSVYFEPRDGYIGEDFILHCYDSENVEAIFTSTSAYRYETSVNNRYLFQISKLRNNVVYHCGLTYHGIAILSQDKSLYIQLRSNNKNYPITYVLFSDVHYCDGLEKFVPFLKEDTKNAEALISLGDNFFSKDSEAFSFYKDIWYNYFNRLRDLLYQVPFYSVLGNHDIGINAESSAVGRRAFLQIFELPNINNIEHAYYSIKGTRHTIIFLDSNNHTIDQPQLDLIDSATSDSADRHAIVLLHHQILGVEDKPTLPHASITRPPPLEFHKYLQTRGVHLVINGHRHFYHVYKKDRTYYITMPTICKDRLMPNNTRVFDNTDGESIIYKDKFYGYGVLEIYEDRMRFILKGFNRADNNISQLKPIEIER